MAHRIVSPSLRNGFIRTSLAAALSLFECAAEAVGLGAGFDDVRPIGDAIQQRFTQARIGNDWSTPKTAGSS